MTKKSIPYYKTMIENLESLIEKGLVNTSEFYSVRGTIAMLKRLNEEALEAERSNVVSISTSFNTTNDLTEEDQNKITRIVNISTNSRDKQLFSLLGLLDIRRHLSGEKSDSFFDKTLPLYWQELFVKWVKTFTSKKQVAIIVYFICHIGDNKKDIVKLFYQEILKLQDELFLPPDIESLRSIRSVIKSANKLVCGELNSEKEHEISNKLIATVRGYFTEEDKIILGVLIDIWKKYGDSFDINKGFNY